MELEQLGGINALLWLIENRQGQIAYSCLLESSAETRTSIDSPLQFEENALLSGRQILENATAVLCNLAAVPQLKLSISEPAVLPRLVELLLKPVATKLSLKEYRFRDFPENLLTNMLLRNIMAIIRYVRDNVRCFP